LRSTKDLRVTQLVKRRINAMISNLTFIYSMRVSKNHHSSFNLFINALPQKTQNKQNIICWYIKERKVNTEKLLLLSITITTTKKKNMGRIVIGELSGPVYAYHAQVPSTKIKSMGGNLRGGKISPHDNKSLLRKSEGQLLVVREWLAIAPFPFPVLLLSAQYTHARK
jgi:hypothetical protein